MEETDPEDLRKAYRGERDPGVKARMAAASMVCVRKVDVGKAADHMQCPDLVSHRVSHRVRRLGEGGIDAISGMPRMALCLVPRCPRRDWDLLNPGDPCSIRLPARLFLARQGGRARLPFGSVGRDFLSGL